MFLLNFSAAPKIQTCNTFADTHLLTSFEDLFELTKNLELMKLRNLWEIYSFNETRITKRAKDVRTP